MRYTRQRRVEGKGGVSQKKRRKLFPTKGIARLCRALRKKGKRERPHFMSKVPRCSRHGPSSMANEEGTADTSFRARDQSAKKDHGSTSKHPNPGHAALALILGFRMDHGWGATKSTFFLGCELCACADGVCERVFGLFVAFSFPFLPICAA